MYTDFMESVYFFQLVAFQHGHRPVVELEASRLSSSAFVLSSEA